MTSPTGALTTDSGRHWEGWIDKAEPVLDGGGELLEAAFAAASVLRTHDRSGIRISLPTSPAESLVARINCALKLAAFLAPIER